MNTTELGVYILGATALAILTASGIALDSRAILIAAALASGLSYVSQLAAVNAVILHSQRSAKAPWLLFVNGLCLVAAVAAWCFGIWTLLTA